jgi:hypothetical protein
MRPMKLALLLCIVCRMFLSPLTLHLSHDRSNYYFPAQRFKSFQALLIYFPKCPRYCSIHGELQTIWKNSINSILCRRLNGNVTYVSGKTPHQISFKDSPLLYLRKALLALSLHKLARSPRSYYRVLEMKEFRRPGILQWHTVYKFRETRYRISKFVPGTAPEKHSMVTLKTYCFPHSGERKANEEKELERKRKCPVLETTGKRTNDVNKPY